MTFREACRESFKKRILALVKYVDFDAPDLILAEGLANAIILAEGAFGKELAEQLLYRRTRHLRQSMGYCQCCDAPISNVATFLPLCEKCDFLEEEEAKKMDEESKDAADMDFLDDEDT